MNQKTSSIRTFKTFKAAESAMNEHNRPLFAQAPKENTREWVRQNLVGISKCKGGFQLATEAATADEYRKNSDAYGLKVTR